MTVHVWCRPCSKWVARGYLPAHVRTRVHLRKLGQLAMPWMPT